MRIRSKKRLLIFTMLYLGILAVVEAQQPSWQQKVFYRMEIDLDVKSHQFKGFQKLTYKNNSPDTLKRVFYHLYFNAFQPGSMMDVRSRTLQDPDKRVKRRIYYLTPEETGYQEIASLKQDGAEVKFEMEETILAVELNKPLLPGKSTNLEMEFSAQVPKQIRRSGRDNAEGISYSMTQWYPKLAEYDQDGWHTNPYVGREFHGVWGNFDVKIDIDSSFVIGGTGYLQNPQEIGHGYEDSSKPVKRKSGRKLQWHFKADNVHDFAWAADPDYVHKKIKVPTGPEVHFFYQEDSVPQFWDSLRVKYASSIFQIMNENFGVYPYKQYSVIQGGDGGMEYPMATLITGHRTLGSLVGVTVHEVIHSWYQGVLANNEAKYPWMDEGFTTFASSFVMERLFDNQKDYQLSSYYGYKGLVRSGFQEPLTTHSDHYETNMAYGTASYSMGAILLNQLSYIIGEQTFFRGMRRYFNEWKFKHPTPTDFKRVMEKESGLELDWYFENWIGTTKKIDYGIKAVIEEEGGTTIVLKKNGDFPMPLDVVVMLKDSSFNSYYIPLQIMRGEKNEKFIGSQFTLKDWPWVYSEYRFTIPIKSNQIMFIEIDPSMRMADIDRDNNDWNMINELQFQGEIKE